MPTNYQSDSEDQGFSLGRLFGREKPLHQVFGGGKVADILLWKDKKLSATILIGFTIIWFLIEVVEYHFVTLLCHSLILAMLINFIWTNVSRLMDWTPPYIPDIRLSTESTFRYFIARLNWFSYKFYEISSGKDFIYLIVAISSLWILSVIGTYMSALNLLYIVFLCAHTLPVFYERYEKEVDYFANRSNRDLKKLYRNFDSKVLNKIPRGPVKDRKYK
ncbi:reticulon-like protein B14 [Quercus robur]|uniref:reticulon-like protein B14 n=1 Tax=Quercus robur TaxID=38942 RepID=UPI0021628F1E|nr:reticulon-like protein B14 [Quercus robur]